MIHVSCVLGKLFGGIVFKIRLIIIVDSRFITIMRSSMILTMWSTKADVAKTCAVLRVGGYGQKLRRLRTVFKAHHEIQREMAIPCRHP